MNGVPLCGNLFIISYPEIPTQQNKETYKKYFELTS